ncbi:MULTISPECIES: hypothetical protein [Bradyrhizobium]|uniref:hypothetical protein n=1 Tax=Bradyrhizobium elkanii TaxID=29448 RepID=UPI0027155442|nr:hypothetical protein [Bradyrhizobium elkanii]WLA46680.1 hypothetical protein QIH80_33780 [Bradyrhizobium elkanii]WLB83036.1 hypothetical protein QIH83_10955 [Bradyrhizobium elkanii]
MASHCGDGIEQKFDAVRIQVHDEGRDGYLCRTDLLESAPLDGVIGRTIVSACLIGALVYFDVEQSIDVLTVDCGIINVFGIAVFA